MTKVFICFCQLAKLRIVWGIRLYDIYYFGQSATIELMHVFMIVGCWVTVDFDSQFKILRGETGARGVCTFFLEKQSSN